MGDCCNLVLLPTSLLLFSEIHRPSFHSLSREAEAKRSFEPNLYSLNVDSVRHHGFIPPACKDVLILFRESSFRYETSV